MSKEWTTPVVEELDIKQTEFQILSTGCDGPWDDDDDAVAVVVVDGEVVGVTTLGS